MKFLKAVIATVVSAAGALVVALGTGNNGGLGSLTTTQWLIVAGTTLGSGGLVAWVENIPSIAPTAKSVVAFLTAGISSLVVALSDNHITQSEYLVAFVAAVTATGLVYQARNAP